MERSDPSPQRAWHARSDNLSGVALYDLHDRVFREAKVAPDQAIGKPLAVHDEHALGFLVKLSTLHKWRRALEAAGVEFIDSDAKSFEGGLGVRLRGAKERSGEGGKRR